VDGQGHPSAALPPGKTRDSPCIGVWERLGDGLKGYSGLIINNGSQKHNYICKYNNLPTTCSFVGRLARGPTDQQMNSPSGHTLVPTPFQPLTRICKRDLVPSPAHLHLDQTDYFPLTLYSNLMMAELGRNM